MCGLELKKLVSKLLLNLLVTSKLICAFLIYNETIRSKAPRIVALTVRTLEVVSEPANKSSMI